MRYNAANSAGMNLGPTNKALIEGIKADMETLKAENPAASLPIELVTTSGSGLDTHISREAALFQVAGPGRTICLRIASATWSTHTASGVCWA